MKREPLERFLRDLGSLYQARRMYPSGNELVHRAAEKAAESLARVGHQVRVARVGPDIIVEDRALGEPPSSLRALLDALAGEGREALQIDAGATAGEFHAWMEGVIGGSEAVSPHIRTGSFALENGHAEAAHLTEAAAGYLSLTPGVQEAMRDLSGEQQGGLRRAREIVQAIATHLATGEELFNPIRGLKSHDDYTFTHALNVSVVAAALARALGLARGLVDLISLAALCHDVGKEKIPLAILNKKGTLDAEERAIMNRHPAEGASILLQLPEGVNPLLPVVAYEHHVGADGSGYPEHPRIGRAHPASLLVAVADVFDALRTTRSYQDPRSAANAFTVMLGLGREGVLYLPYLCVFARLTGLLRPGGRVGLSDGREAVVVEEGLLNPLEPVVETEEGELLGLGPTTPWIDKVHDSEGELPRG